jgi:hypothetical protein
LVAGNGDVGGGPHGKEPQQQRHDLCEPDDAGLG